MENNKWPTLRKHSSLNYPPTTTFSDGDSCLKDPTDNVCRSDYICSKVGAPQNQTKEDLMTQNYFHYIP